MNQPLLEINHLVTQFRTEDETLKAVNDVSFTLNKGETIGIVGESGSGKSVTALSVMRLISNPPGKIASGEIIYHSRHSGPVDLLKLPEKEMRKYRGNEIAMIFQEPMTSLNPVYTCGYQVLEAIVLHQKRSKSKNTRPLPRSTAPAARNPVQHLPPPDLRGPETTCHDRHGHVLQPLRTHC